VSGTILYNTLENTYGNAEFGNIQPNLGVTTVKGYSYIKEKFQTQQRFNDTQDPAIGFTSEVQLSHPDQVALLPRV